jgi:hypothetical protein
VASPAFCAAKHFSNGAAKMFRFKRDTFLTIFSAAEIQQLSRMKDKKNTSITLLRPDHPAIPSVLLLHMASVESNNI